MPMESANIPVSENVNIMNLSINQERLKDSLNEPKQSIDVITKNLILVFIEMYRSLVVNVRR